MKKIVAIFVSIFAVSVMAAAPTAPVPVPVVSAHAVTKEKVKSGVKAPKKVKKAKATKVETPKVEIKK